MGPRVHPCYGRDCYSFCYCDGERQFEMREIPDPDTGKLLWDFLEGDAKEFL